MYYVYECVCVVGWFVLCVCVLFFFFFCIGFVCVCVINKMDEKTVMWSKER